MSKAHNYEVWKSQLAIFNNLTEILYGLAPEDLENASQVNRRIKETLFVITSSKERERSK